MVLWSESRSGKESKGAETFVWSRTRSCNKVLAPTLAPGFSFDFIYNESNIEIKLFIAKMKFLLKIVIYLPKCILILNIKK